MAKKKYSDIELKIKNYSLPEINHAFERSVSYSQYSMWASCPHKWYLTYVENKQPYQASIHTVFGTAFHETLQQYITTMYEVSGAEADKMDLESLFQERFREVYSKEYKAAGAHFSTAEEMGSFFDDGIAILKWIKTRRNKLFTIRKMKLLGIELPLLLKLSNNIYYKAFIDFALYDEDLNKVYIYDIKTSTRGWSDYEKRDSQKTAQVLLYKEYFAKQYGWDVEQIEVEFFIVKRKIYEDSEYPIPRVQSFRPPSGKTKRKQTIESFESFIKDCFDNVGKPQLKSYLKNVGESACKWCPYKDDLSLCDKVASSS
jgi:hypothetical protein